MTASPVAFEMSMPGRPKCEYRSAEALRCSGDSAGGRDERRQRNRQPRLRLHDRRERGPELGA